MMELDEILDGESILEELVNIIKRTPESLSSYEDGGEEFEAVEHENIGNKVKLRFPHPDRTSPPQEVLGAKRLLRLPNGLRLYFGQIIALAGDFYGVPEHPIIDPGEKRGDQKSGRRERFIEAYNTLAKADYKVVKKELDEILKIMTKERNEIESVLEDRDEKIAISGDDSKIRVVPKDVYDKLGTSLVKQWDEVTGGKWIFGVPLIFGRIMKLAANNHDHFLPYAEHAYLAGHELALEKAKEASKIGHQEERIRRLEEAYSIDAFACHFLTDSFSSGHIRTPRRELAKQVTPSKVGDLLCKYMHDEDNKQGIRVANRMGNKWIAYGDGMILDESEMNFKIAVLAVQKSVDHIYEAFQCPTQLTSSSVVTDYIPFVDADEENNYPMFQVKDGKLLRRDDLENLSDPKTTSDWNGMVTVVKLRSYKPHDSAIEEYDDDEVDCRGCGQSLDPEIIAENTAS